MPEKFAENNPFKEKLKHYIKLLAIATLGVLGLHLFKKS
jgi:hypothetical protein